MTTDELFKHITSEPKWYAGKFSPQIASRIKRHYKKGIYRPDSLVRLFAKFGYVQKEIIWQRDICRFTDKKYIIGHVVGLDEDQDGLTVKIKCKHDYILSADTFEAPYCKHCYKER